MHIANFTNFYLPVVSGVVRSVESYRDALSKQGHNVFIFAQSAGDYEDRAPFIFRYPSLTLPIQVDIPAVIPVSPFIDQLLPLLKPEVIHTHHPVILGQTAARKATEHKLPLVFTFHTQYREYTHYFPMPQEDIQEFLKNAVDNWLRHYMRQCQHIVIPSESMQSILSREYGLKDHYTVVPTGIDLQPYLATDSSELRRRQNWQDDKVMVSVGRLAAEKNWETLLKAVASVYQQHTDLRVVLIGDGPKKDALKTLAGKLGISERVTFTGELPLKDVVVHLKAADFFGFASVTETQGLVTMEAMAAGLPIVAVDASGTRDIVDDGEQGFMTPNDPEALAASINRLLESPELMRKFSQNALKKANTFEVGRLAKKLIEVYGQAIQDKAEKQYVTIEE